MASLDLSLKWLHRLRGMPEQQLIAVQDGMCVDDVRDYLGPMVGLFIGGSTPWKLATLEGLCRDKAKIRTFVLQDIELKGNLLSS